MKQVTIFYDSSGRTVCIQNNKHVEMLINLQICKLVFPMFLCRLRNLNFNKFRESNPGVEFVSHDTFISYNRLLNVDLTIQTLLLSIMFEFSPQTETSEINTLNYKIDRHMLDILNIYSPNSNSIISGEIICVDNTNIVITPEYIDNLIIQKGKSYETE